MVQIELVMCLCGISSQRFEGYLRLLEFDGMPLPRRSLHLSRLQAAALLALGLPPVVSLGSPVSWIVGNVFIARSIPQQLAYRYTVDS